VKPRRREWDGSDPVALARDLRAGQPALEDVADSVAGVIAAVEGRGDEALLELGERFDGVKPASLRVGDDVAAEALAGLEPELRESLEVAAANVRAVAKAQISEASELELPQGQRVTVAEVPVSSAGIYAPGGAAAYPSSVLMCAIPARVAGVERIALASPPGDDGLPNPLVLAAAAFCEVDEVYAMGGAQAIAALVLGTPSVESVDVVAGPGNRYVTEAKRQLAGSAGIDSLAGPSELMVVLGDGGEPRWAALDLAAQGEHSADGLLVACAVESELLDRLKEELAGLAGKVGEEAEITLVQVPDTDAAVALANAMAPEHLQLMCSDAELLARGVRTAGCVFCGSEAATAFGDYAAGSNHVLPTGGAGRFSGPLGPGVFRRRISLVSLPGSAARELAPHVERLARAEGFPVHAESAAARAAESD
jgi:histidinol dehydrogenase